jgi:hypothetical protein
MEDQGINGENNDLKEYMLKEVDLIQNIIKRMASNSFFIKGWTITLVVATLLLKDENGKVLIAYVPLIVFWYLDSYFLQQERMYRELYNWVIKNRLKTDEHLLDMNASKRFSSKVNSKVQIMFSETLLSFYGSILLLLTIIVIYLFINNLISVVLKILIIICFFKM